MSLAILSILNMTYYVSYNYVVHGARVANARKEMRNASAFRCPSRLRVIIIKPREVPGSFS